MPPRATIPYMARIARAVVLGIPHHITQRGNNRQTVFQTATDRLVYLELLCKYAALHRVQILGFCYATL